MSSLQEKVNKAKLLLLKKRHFAFISSMLYKLNYKETKDTQSMYYVGSESTIYLNKDWFLGLSDQEACSALAHETLHYALQHDLRMGKRDPELFNKAADHVVNNILMDCDFELPADVPVDRRFQNKTTEYVYKFMEEEQKQNQNQNQNSNNPFGNDLRPNPSPSPQEQSQRDRETLSASQQDQQTVGNDKSIGSSQEAFSELFKNILEGKKNWRDILLEFINEKSQGEKSWRELDRRMLQLGYYLPNNITDNRIHRIAVAVDVSGSVSPEQINYFLREIKAIKSNCNPEVLDVISFNTRITGKWSFKEEDEIDNIEMDIDGGTSLKPVYKHYDKQENKPNFLIVFSDMWVEIPNKPNYEVIWGIVDNPNFKTSYGKHIYINQEDYENV